MAHCAFVLGTSDAGKTLRQTQYVLEECHFPFRSKAVFTQKSWRKWLPGKSIDWVSLLKLLSRNKDKRMETRL